MADMARTIEFCGAFNGTAKLRDGETPRQAAERIEAAIQAVLDDRAKSLAVAVGVDFADLKVDGIVQPYGV